MFGVPAKAHRLPVVDPLVVPRLLFPILSFLRRLRSASMQQCDCAATALHSEAFCFRGSLRLLLGLALGLSRPCAKRTLSRHFGLSKTESSGALLLRFLSCPSSLTS